VAVLTGRHLRIWLRRSRHSRIFAHSRIARIASAFTLINTLVNTDQQNFQRSSHVALPSAPATCVIDASGRASRLPSCRLQRRL
jgi:hypothetical protein